MILVSKYIVPNGYIGMALFPFVFLKHSKLKDNKVFLNHEHIHLRQQLELLILPFFIWYAVEFLIRYLRYRDWNMAYHKISFEREAYLNESEMNYLQQRRIWNFLKYC